MGMCYVYAMVPQRCFIGQKNKTYEIILLLVCIDMIFHTRIDWISVCGCLCRIERSRTPTGSNRDDRRWSRLITMAISMIAMVVAAVYVACPTRHNAIIDVAIRGKTAHASGCHAPPPPSARMIERAILCVRVWAAGASRARLPPIATPPIVCTNRLPLARFPGSARPRKEPVP